MGVLAAVATIAAVILMAVGPAVAWSGVRWGATGPHRRMRDPDRALGLVRGFRITIVGLCLTAVGAALYWQIGWLLVLSLIIGGEELLESSVHIAALRHRPTSPRRMRAIVYCGALPPD
jgi:hypothetical protein